MPIIIEGYLVTSTKKLREHEGHHLSPDGAGGRIALWCVDDQVVLEQEPEPRNDLPCGCRDKAEHDEGVGIQEEYQRRAGKNTCVGCYLGDDGPSVHSCAIHPRGDWA